MSKTKIINVNKTLVSIIDKEGKDYISLTDMVKDNGGNDKIQNWIRNKDTIEFLGIWEQFNNPDFNSVQLHRIMYEAGVRRFIISISQWIEQTNAIGIISKTGKYGGTYAHKDIAFEFGSYLSPVFKMYLIKEFQKLKDEEAKTHNLDWDVKRLLSKINYRIHTDAIKDKLENWNKNLTKDEEGYIYANEAEILNMAMFGQTSKDWRIENPSEVLKGLNIRDIADLHQLTVLANLEGLNATLIRRGLNGKERFKIVSIEANEQLKTLRGSPYTMGSIQSPYLIQHTTGQLSTFNKVPAKKK